MSGTYDNQGFTDIEKNKYQNQHNQHDGSSGSSDTMSDLQSPKSKKNLYLIIGGKIVSGLLKEDI